MLKEFNKLDLVKSKPPDNSNQLVIPSRGQIIGLLLLGVTFLGSTHGVMLLVLLAAFGGSSEDQAVAESLAKVAFWALSVLGIITFSLGLVSWLFRVKRQNFSRVFIFLPLVAVVAVSIIVLIATSSTAREDYRRSSRDNQRTQQVEGLQTELHQYYLNNAEYPNELMELKLDRERYVDYKNGRYPYEEEVRPLLDPQTKQPYEYKKLPKDYSLCINYEHNPRRCYSAADIPVGKKEVISPQVLTVLVNGSDQLWQTIKRGHRFTLSWDATPNYSSCSADINAFKIAADQLWDDHSLPLSGSVVLLASPQPGFSLGDRVFVGISCSSRTGTTDRIDTEGINIDLID